VRASGDIHKPNDELHHHEHERDNHYHTITELHIPGAQLHLHAAPAPSACVTADRLQRKGRRHRLDHQGSWVAVLQFECPKCTSNTIVTTDGSESLLVNEIGSYTGKHLIDLRDGSTTTTVTVKASGAWKMTVASGLGAAKVGAGDAPVAGQGDDVVLMKGTATKGAHHQPWAVQLHRVRDLDPVTLNQPGSQPDRRLRGDCGVGRTRRNRGQVLGQLDDHTILTVRRTSRRRSPKPQKQMPST
jgi:hypothetical protein